MPLPTEAPAAPAWLDALGAGLARLAASTPRPLRGMLRGLPSQPPSFAAARVLDHLLLPRLDDSVRAAWSGRVVGLEVADLGLRMRLCLGRRGFEVGTEAPVVTIRGAASALWRLARGEEDADRLFFERQLLMEGDTEFGLLIKNTLDAIGPLWQPAAAAAPGLGGASGARP